MFEFNRLCTAFEELTPVEKGLILTERSVSILARLSALDIPGIDPVDALAGFLIGSVAADGRINEQEYLLIYPALVRVFGDRFDFSSIKAAFRDASGRKALASYNMDMLRVFAFLDDSLKNDVITLCLRVMAIDGRVSLKEKRYIRRLCSQT